MDFLTANGVAFSDRDVAVDPQYMQELLAWTGGVRGTPVIVVGDTVMRGFDRGKLQRLLGIA